MYGQQRGQTGGYQQAQPQPQPSFQYGQPTGYGQPPSGYPQSQPVRTPGPPHDTSFSGYGVTPSGPPPSTGQAFDGPVRQRTHSDNSATGQPTKHQVFCTLVAAPQITCSTSLIFSTMELDRIMANFQLPDWHAWLANNLSTVAIVGNLCSKLCLSKMNVGVVCIEVCDYISLAVQVMFIQHLILSPTLGVSLGHCQASQCPDRHLGHLFILGQTHLPVLLCLPTQHHPSPLDSMRSQGRVPAKLATSPSMMLFWGAATLHLPRIRPLGPADRHPSHLEIHLPD